MWPRATVLLLLVAFLAHLALCVEDYYSVLGLPRTATDKQLKTAYRQLSKKYHPDKNWGSSTSHEKFVLVSEAYETLSDPALRQIYDTQGFDGVKRHKESGGRGNAAAHDPFDLFSRFFGGGGHFSPQQKRGPNMELKVGVSLRDFWLGVETELEWTKQHICETCSGTGSADGHVETCHACGGHGIRIRKQQLAPGMFQQMQVPCDVCGQRGKVVKHKCKTCDGTRVVKKATPLQLKVSRGLRNHARIVYENEADASPDWVAGDLILNLIEREPGVERENPDKVDAAFFKRRDDDLYWTEILSVREAWMGGWSRNLTHFDGHVIRLGREPGQVVQPEHVETIEGEGMPIYHEDNGDAYYEMKFGKLFVEYVVVLPDQMDKEMEEEFRKLFDKWKGKVGVNVDEDLGRVERTKIKVEHDEL